MVGILSRSGIGVPLIVDSGFQYFPGILRCYAYPRSWHIAVDGAFSFEGTDARSNGVCRQNSGPSAACRLLQVQELVQKASRQVGDRETISAQGLDEGQVSTHIAIACQSCRTEVTMLLDLRSLWRTHWHSTRSFFYKHTKTKQTKPQTRNEQNKQTQTNTNKHKQRNKTKTMALIIIVFVRQ